MGDDIRHRALIADVSRRLALLSVGEVQIVDRAVQAIERFKRDPEGEVIRNPLALALLDVAMDLAAEDRDRAKLREQARVEMLGEGDPREFSGDQHLTRLSNTPAVLALAEVPRDRDEDLEVELEVEWDLSDVHAGEGS